MVPKQVEENRAGKAGEPKRPQDKAVGRSYRSPRVHQVGTLKDMQGNMSYDTYDSYRYYQRIR